MHIVWFKRDLRISDHRPLYEASRHGPVLPLYVVEPSVTGAPDFGTRHWEFIRGSLTELRVSLAALGQPLVVQTGEAADVFRHLYETLGPFTLYAHEETGNDITFQRDIAVRKWAESEGIPFHEYYQNGVVRMLRDRDGWSKIWDKRMGEELVPSPGRLEPVTGIVADDIPTSEHLSLPPLQGTVQESGERAARQTLQSFLYERGQPYHYALSGPLTAFDYCSRLSPHIAWGTISLRTVVQALRTRQAELKDETTPEAVEWRKSLRAFNGRLHWHSHFIQKLESDPAIEFQGFIPAYDTLREDEFDQGRFEAWCRGRTGFPMVDACMRALTETGYLNFRMRAMLVSFASYNLWLDWRKTGHFLARQWTDYEPGIHYSQLQMQSGTTGINTIRIYSPTKQGKDHDPEGIFIKKWVPELEGVPLKYIHEPVTMPPEVQEQAGCMIGRDYPEPIVDHVVTGKEARRRIYELRRLPELRQQAEKVMERHGSRKRPSSRRTSRKKTPAKKS